MMPRLYGFHAYAFYLSSGSVTLPVYSPVVFLSMFPLLFMVIQYLSMSHVSEYALKK